MFYELKNLKKAYDGRTVLDLKTLTLEKGKIIGVLGPNGAGKTTLLEILAFLSAPTSGEFWFEKEKVDFTGGKLIDLRRKVVFVQQQPILFTTTVSNNVEFPLRIRRKAKAERERIVWELLDLVEMGAFGQVIQKITSFPIITSKLLLDGEQSVPFSQQEFPLSILLL